MRKTGLKIFVLALLLTVLGSVGVSAQTTNLLTNGGLEEDSFGPYTGRRGGEFPIELPGGWNYWFGPQNGDRINFAAKIAIRPHPGPGPSPTEGRRALNIDCGYYICTVAIYQQVANITANSNVQASAWSQVKACNLGGGTSCGSAIESGSQTRIGIDPNGGTDPNDTDVVWSAWTAPHDQWLQQTTSATATGTTVTVFLYSTQSSIADLNKTYWDAVSLTGGGTGGANPAAATPVPTVPPSVPFVVQQGAQPDGSIVHTVQPGDTIDSIAYAYGVGRSTIMELNNISDPRIIQLGQKLLIKAAPEGGSSGDSSTTSSGDETASPTEASAEPTEAASEETAEPNSAVATQETQPTAEQSAETTTEPTTEPQTIAPVGQQPTATAPLATAPVVVANAGAIDPASTTASVCVSLFNDADQNRIQEQGEDLLKGGKISISTGTEASQSYDTDGLSEPHCFENLAAGDYTAVAQAPDGFGLTTADQFRVRVNPGATININFGAAEGVQALQPPPADSAPLTNETVSAQTAQESTSDRLLSISGLVIFGIAAVVLVGGLGLALVMRRR